MLIRLQRIYNFFIVPCYYIILLGCLMGFIIHFYMIFGTNLLTQSPVPVSVFSYFRVLQKRNIKRSPIDEPIFYDFFWTKRSPRSKRVGPGEPQAALEGGGRALGRGARPPISRTARSPPLFGLDSKNFYKY